MASQTIRVRVRALESSLSEKERQLAEFLLADPHKASKMTISQIAQTLGMADSTVFKFTQKLGFEGFRDFRGELAAEGFDPEVSIHEHITHKSTPKQMAETVFESSIRSLTDTKELLSEQDIIHAAKLIKDCCQLTFYGMGGSSVVAADAYHKFLRTPKRVAYDADFHLQLMRASRSNENDCALLISHSGRCLQTIQIAEKLREVGASTIVITSSPASPLAALADARLITIAEETAYRSESLASRISQLALIDALYTIVMFSDENAASRSLKEVRKVISTTRKA